MKPRSFLVRLAVVGWFGSVHAQCHAEGDREYCLKGYTTTSTPDCHMVGNELVCFGIGGSATATVAHVATNTIHHVSASATGPPMQDHAKPSKAGSDHARETGGAHLADADAEEDHDMEMAEKGHGHGHGSAASGKCEVLEKEEYSLKLRVAAIFIVFTTSTIGVLAPIFLRRFTRVQSGGLVFTFIKQFGTGIIISTVFIHLLTHAVIQFSNPCVGELAYEGTVLGIAMGGAFLSFLIDFAGIQWLRKNHEHHPIPDQPTPFVGTFQDDKSKNVIAVERVETAEVLAMRRNKIDEEKLSVMIMEGGIIFHSILIGVLLAVTADPEFPVLFAVVLVHQMFEGIALGARVGPLECVSEKMKLFMGLAFSATSPVGMAIGIGVRKSFNGMDRTTLITLGTMDALSGGVLAWVGFVELWAKDWLFGELRTADGKKSAVAMVGLVLGLFIMSLLGKWA